MRNLMGLKITCILVVALTLVACGASTHKALMTSGETLKASGQQFQTVAAAYVTGCKAGTILPGQCAQFRAFGLQFERAFPLAVELWTIAAEANDRASVTKAQDMIAGLVGQLSLFTVQVLGAYVPAGGK